MNRFFKIFAIFILCGIPVFIIRLVFNYEVPGLETMTFLIALMICAYLGLIPNVLVKRTVKDKKKKK